MNFVGIDKFSLLDYDDMISIVLFSPTCNFRCDYCHNIEGVVDSKSYIPFVEILTYLKSRIGVIDAVVISGGEPTLMPDLVDKIKAIKALGFKIKLDTNGTNPDVIARLIDDNLIDYVAMDIKTSLNQYENVAKRKVNIENIKKSISLLLENKIDYEFRTTLVKQYHDFDVIKDIANDIKGAKKYYLQKFVYREGVINNSLQEIDINSVKEYITYLKQYISIVEIRGY